MIIEKKSKNNIAYVPALEKKIAKMLTAWGHYFCRTFELTGEANSLARQFIANQVF